MTLIMIENRNLLAKIVSYFDYLKIDYTTNPQHDYQYLLVAELNKRIINRIENNVNNHKKIIFLAYLEEPKIIELCKSQSLRAIKYYNLLTSTLNLCYKVIVSLPSIRDLLKNRIDSKVEVIEKENPRFIKPLKIKEKNNSCLIIDNNYKRLKEINELALKFPKVSFTLLGYLPDYSLSSQKINLLYNLPSNIIIIKTCDLFTYLELIIENKITIYCENTLLDHENILYIILLKGQLLVKDTLLYDKYFINSKNLYLYKDSKDFILKVSKMLNKQISNLSGDTYLFICHNNLPGISHKFKELLK